MFRGLGYAWRSCFDNEPTPSIADGDHFKVLLTHVEAYKSKHHAIGLPDPKMTDKQKPRVVESTMIILIGLFALCVSTWILCWYIGSQASIVGAVVMTLVVLSVFGIYWILDHLT